MNLEMSHLNQCHYVRIRKGILAGRQGTQDERARVAKGSSHLKTSTKRGSGLQVDAGLASSAKRKFLEGSVGKGGQP
jgi:hypothetical protein